MRTFVLVTALLLAGGAWAQSAPDVVAIPQQDTINLAVGQALKLRFPVVFDRIDLTAEAVARANPLSDQVVTLQGLAPGETIMTVFSGSKELWTGSIIIGAERGRTVRIYDGKSKDFTGYYCTDVFCGRADKELNGAREVGSVTTSIGGVARTVTYGGNR